MFSACRWLALCAALAAQEKPDLVFGTTVVSTTGLKGSIYILKKDTTWLPNLTKMKPVGEIYTTSLRVTPRNFTAGFPGVTDRNEWFAIGYEGRFWVEQPGRYRFQTTSDDGSKLLIDGKVLVDNDGVHAMTRVEGSALLTRGIHTMRVDYFQGPGFHIGLMVEVKRPDEQSWRPFDTDDFKPPPDDTLWVNGKISGVEKGIL